MKFSENWLRTFVDPPLPADELAQALTMAGLEVEGIEAVAPVFSKVVVAEVLAVEKHPDAKHLSVCLVNADEQSTAQPLRIVCGAANVRAGMKVPCALVGAQLPGLTIRQATIRAVESAGMLCSAKELGLEDAAGGLLVLPHDAPTGEDFRQYYELEDKLFTLKLTPNRSDCLGLVGIAREVAAITDTNLEPLQVEPVAPQIDETLTVCVEAPQACPLYCGRVVRAISPDVPTPLWMVRRLERSGLRPVNSVVDVTNYVMLETGQPLHAFDLAKISGAPRASIHIRYARAGEALRLLNEEDVDLRPGMLVIADEEKPLALAGIMGGIDSRVTTETMDLFLESAFFNPHAIAGKSFSLGFGSDSAHRFERGVDFAATRTAIERATRLILEICGGRAGPVTEIRNQLPRRDPIRLRAERARRVLGVDLGGADISKLFQRLRFEFSSADGVFQVTPPTHRFDLTLEEDLIEEIARINGYDQISTDLPKVQLAMLPQPETLKAPSRLREMMVDRGYQEVINYAFVDKFWEHSLVGNQAPISLKNPLSSQMTVMRSSLLGGLVSNLQFNLNRKQSRIRLFEIGSCFTWADGKHVQQEKIAGLCYGNALPEQWGWPAREVDFFDVKADIEALFWPDTVHAIPASHTALHPGKSALIRVGGKDAGYLGELHPRWQQKLELSGSVMLFELDMQILMARALPKAAEISKYPPIRRDIAVIVAEEISVQAMLDLMYIRKPAIILEISVFDVYRGKGVETAKKSLAFRILLQDTEKTLTDAEADEAVSMLLDVLEGQFDAKLRN